MITLPKSPIRFKVRLKFSPELNSKARSIPFGQTDFTSSSQWGFDEFKAISTPFFIIASCLVGDAKPTTFTPETVRANCVAAHPTPPNTLEFE